MTTDHNEAMSQLPHKLATLIKCLPQAPFRDHLAGECIKQAERIAELEAERDTLRAEVERLKPNAERYEWLRRCRGMEHDPLFTVHHELDGTLWGGDLDAAIDTARKEAQ